MSDNIISVYPFNARNLSVRKVVNIIKNEIKEKFCEFDIRVRFCKNTITIYYACADKDVAELDYALWCSFNYLTYDFLDPHTDFHYCKYHWLSPDNKIYSAFTDFDIDESSICKPDPNYELVSLDSKYVLFCRF